MYLFKKYFQKMGLSVDLVFFLCYNLGNSVNTSDLIKNITDKKQKANELQCLLAFVFAV